MKRTSSTPILSSRKHTDIKRNISVNCLHDLIILTNNPIINLQCYETHYESKKDLASCVMTPCEDINENGINFANTNRRFLEYSMSDISLQQRYVAWLNRIRKKTK